MIKEVKPEVLVIVDFIEIVNHIIAIIVMVIVFAVTMVIPFVITIKKFILFLLVDRNHLDLHRLFARAGICDEELFVGDRVRRWTGWHHRWLHGRSSIFT